MAIVITRTMIVPGWLLACALVVLVAPSAIASAGLLLFSCGLVLAATLLGRNTVNALVVDRLPTIDVRPLSVTAVEWRAVGPNSWPDSGFRNIARGTKGG
jgi:hypothetical protein